MMTTIYQYGSEKFGVIEKKVQPQEARGQSRHQKEIKGIRKELRALTKRMESGQQEWWQIRNNEN